MWPEDEGPITDTSLSASSALQGQLCPEQPQQVACPPAWALSKGIRVLQGLNPAAALPNAQLYMMG